MREFGLLLGGNRLDAAGVDGLAVDRLELVRQEVPDFDVRHLVVDEVQVAERLEGKQPRNVSNRIMTTRATVSRPKIDSSPAEQLPNQ